MDTASQTDPTGTDPPRSGRIPLAAEILGYVGGAMALGAVVTLLTTYWIQLGLYGRVGIALGVSLAGLLGGWAVSRVTSAAAGRLTQFLLFVGVVGAGAAVGFDVLETLGRSPGMSANVASATLGTLAADWAAFAGFATAAVLGGAIWWRRRTTMQHLAFGLGVGIGTLLLLPLLPVDGPEWGAGATLALVGLVWGALGLKGWLPPENAALTLASLGLLGGIEMMAVMLSPGDLSVVWPLWLGIAVSVVLLLGAILRRRMVLLGFGAAGVVIFAFELINVAYGGTIGAPIAMLIAGLLFVGMSVVVAAVLPRMSHPDLDEGVAPQARQVSPDATAPDAGSIGSTTGVVAVEPAPIPLAAEILGYVGGAFAVGAAVALMTTFWEPLGAYGRLGVAALGAAFGLVGGYLVGKQGSAPARRLEQFMLAIGAVAVGFTVGVLAYEFTLPSFGSPSPERPFDLASTWALVAGALAASLAGFAIWSRRKTGLTLVVAVLALMIGLLNVSDALFAGNTEAYWVSPTILIGLGVILGTGAVSRILSPVNAAWALASFFALMGIQNLTYSPVSAGRMPVALWSGLAVSVAMIVGSIPLRRAVILGFGAAGVVLFSAQIVSDLFEGQIAGPVILLVIGILFVGMAVLVAMMLPRLSRKQHDQGMRPPPLETGGPSPA